MLDIKKLSKILGMLGSDHDGEVVAAGRRADAMIKASGLTWHQVFKFQADAYDDRDPPRQQYQNLNDFNDVLYAKIRLMYLSTWEKEFIESLNVWLKTHRALTQKQRERLNQILAKLKRYGV